MPFWGRDFCRICPRSSQAEPYRYLAAMIGGSDPYFRLVIICDPAALSGFFDFPDNLTKNEKKSLASCPIPLSMVILCSGFPFLDSAF